MYAQLLGACVYTELLGACAYTQLLGACAYTQLFGVHTQLLGAGYVTPLGALPRVVRRAVAVAALEPFLRRDIDGALSIY